MSELTQYPTPNWFTAQPISVRPSDGYLAASAHSNIVVTAPLFDRFLCARKDAHTGKRILALSFQRHAEQRLLASCGEDLEVKVWNVEGLTQINHHTLHQSTPTCLDWLDTSDGWLVSCDVKGNVFKWNSTTGSHVRYFPENKPVSQVKACPGQPFLLAIGYKQGNIVILNVEKEVMQIVHKLKNHEDTINCLCWHPSSGDASTAVLDERERLADKLHVDALYTLLASSSEDKTVRVWCTTKGIEVKCMKAPSSGSQNRSKQDIRGATTAPINFTPLNWPQTRYILSGSYSGELTYIDLLDDERQIIPSTRTTHWHSFTPLHPGKEHKRVIYDITVYKDHIITLSLDKLINIWNLKNFKQESSMSTLNGFVHSIISSPIDPSTLAISVGDCSIKVLNEKQHGRFARSINKNINSEVTQICWHPTKEATMAFGTKDGKVGIADVLSPQKPAQFVYTAYKQSVYTLIWSRTLLPSESEVSSGVYLLYSVSNGKCMQHSITSLSDCSTAKSTNFNEELTKCLQQSSGNVDTNNGVESGITDLASVTTTSGACYFTLGKSDGSIELYRCADVDRPLRQLCTLYNHQKLITSIKWSSDATLLASGSNDFSIIVVDFEALKNQLDVPDESPRGIKLFSKYKHKLMGHRERVTCISWSQVSGAYLLASSSYDTTVQVWDANLGTPLANYRGHCDKVICCLFAPNEVNTVYSAGEDYSLHRWRIDAQPFNIPPEECSILVGKKKTTFLKKQFKKSEAVKSGVTEVAQENVDSATTKLTTEQRGAVPLPPMRDITNLDIDSKKTPHDVLDVAKSATVTMTSTDMSTSWTRRGGSGTGPKIDIRSLLMLFTQSKGQKSTCDKIMDCLTFLDVIRSIDDVALGPFNFSSDQIYLNLFGNRQSVLRLLHLEQLELKRLGCEKGHVLEVWRGNLARVVEEARVSGQLTDLLLALYQVATTPSQQQTPLLGAYIKQLNVPVTTTNYDNIHKAAMYALACYDVHRAIDIYVSHNLYTYALCLAQIRLAHDDPALGTLLTQYGVYAKQTGDYEIAVLCYLRVGDTQSAAQMVTRRDHKNDTRAVDAAKLLLEKLVT